MSILNNMPHKCSIYRMGYTKGKQAGRKTGLVLVSSGVSCWEQPTGATEALKYQKQGMSVSSEVYFTTNPNVTRRHKIVITERLGVAVPEASQSELSVTATPLPDTTAGLGVVYKVMCNQATSEDT